MWHTSVTRVLGASGEKAGIQDQPLLGSVAGRVAPLPSTVLGKVAAAHQGPLANKEWGDAGCVWGEQGALWTRISPAVCSGLW